MKCPNCSGELSFDITAQKVRCPYCRSVFNPATMEIDVKYAGESKEQTTTPQETKELEQHKEETLDANNSYEGRSYTCSQCGATLLTFDETAVTFCSYCGSQAILESKMVRVNNPDYVIPFTKTRDECIDNYKKKIKKSLFAPSYMKSKITIQKFRGIFMPYIVYHLEYHGDYKAEGSRRRERRGDYIYYDDYDLVTKVDADYQGISYDLISKYYDKYSEKIPFDFNGAEKFNVSYLAGFYADSKDVDNDTYDQIASNIVKGECKTELMHLKEYKYYSVKEKEVEMPLNIKERKVGYFPVYFLSVRDKKNEHISYAVVNGQTGKVATDIPVDFKKYILLTIIVAILIFLLIDNYVLILPKIVLALALFSSLISLIISNTQLNRLNFRKQHLDDMGFVSQDKEKYQREINLINNKSKKLKLSSIRDDEILKTFFSMILFFIVFFFAAGIFLVFVGHSSFDEYFKQVFQPFCIFLVASTILYIVAEIIRAIHLFISNRLKVSHKNNAITNNGKMPFSEKISKYLYKQIIAILVGIMVLIINPVNDMYYYFGALLSFALTVYSFHDLVKEHNEIISNKLPQLEKRGGDEND